MARPDIPLALNATTTHSPSQPLMMGYHIGYTCYVTAQWWLPRSKTTHTSGFVQYFIQQVSQPASFTVQEQYPSGHFLLPSWSQPTLTTIPTNKFLSGRSAPLLNGGGRLCLNLHGISMGGTPLLTKTHLGSMLIAAWHQWISRTFFWTAVLKRLTPCTNPLLTAPPSHACLYYEWTTQTG